MINSIFFLLVLLFFFVLRLMTNGLIAADPVAVKAILLLPEDACQMISIRAH